MELKLVLRLCKRQISPYIYYVRKIAENEYIAQSNFYNSVIEYKIKVVDGKIVLISPSR